MTMDPKAQQYFFLRRSARQISKFLVRQKMCKPTGQVPTNKPEPMSTRTKYTMPHENNRPNQSNFFKPNGPRNFVSQELYQIDENENTQNKTAGEASGVNENFEQIKNQNNAENYNNFMQNQESHYLNAEMTNQYQDFNEYNSFSDIDCTDDYYQNNDEYQNFMLTSQSPFGM